MRRILLGLLLALPIVAVLGWVAYIDITSQENPSTASLTQWFAANLITAAVASVCAIVAAYFVTQAARWAANKVRRLP